MSDLFHLPPKQGLYDPEFEKDACGVGFIAQIKGVPSHQIVLDADTILQNMDHRGACESRTNTGDGSGILCGMPHGFMRKVAKRDLNIELPEPGKYSAGLVFLPKDEAQREHCRALINRLVADPGRSCSVGAMWCRRPIMQTLDLQHVAANHGSRCCLSVPRMASMKQPLNASSM